MKQYLTEIMVIIVPESPTFNIIIFVIVITTTIATYICTCLTVIRITTAVTLIMPIYFVIRVAMLTYINISILTERIPVVMQLSTDLFTVQCMPTGRCHWDITTKKKYADTSQNLLQSSQKYYMERLVNTSARRKALIIY
jgi:hypothetical protein